MNRGSLHTKSFRRKKKRVSGGYPSQFLDTDYLKNGFAGPKSFRGLGETGPWFDRMIANA